MSWRPRPVPSAAPRAIERTALLERLDGVPARALTVLSAPTGAGKTDLVAAWCRDRAPGTVVWLERDAAGSPLGEALDDLAAPRDEDLVVVVDALDDPGELAVLLQERGTPHLVVTTRRPMVGELARVRLDASFDQLHDGDLQLTPTELVRLIEAHAGHGPSAELAAALCAAIDGWTAAGVLLALDFRGDATLANHRSTLARGFSGAASLAVDATLDGAPDALADLLEQTAVVPELSPGLLDEISGRDDSRTLLRELRDRGALLASRSSEPSLLRLHPLARTGLIERSHRSDAERGAVLAAAGRWFAEHRMPILAVRCYGEQGDWETAGEVAIAHLHELEQQDRAEELAGVLVHLPPTLLRRHWKWVTLAAWMRYVGGDVGGGLAVVGLVAPGARPDQLVIAEYMRAVPAIQVSDPTPCLEAAERGLVLCDAVGDDATFEDVLVASTTEHWRSLLRGLGLIAGAYLGEWERVRPLLTPVDPIAAAGMRPGEVAATRGRRSFHATAAGDLVTAADEVRTLRATVSRTDGHATAMAMQSLWAEAEVRRAHGTFEGIPELLDRADHLARPRSVYNLLASTAASRAFLALDLHQPERALEALATYRRTTPHQPPPLVAGWMAAAEATAHAALGDAERARRILAHAIWTPAVAGALVLIALEQNDLAAARAALDGWPDDPTIRSTLGHHLGCAALSERLGIRQDAVDHLTRALEVAAPQQLLQPFLAAGAHVLGPLWQIARSGGGPGVVDLAERATAQLRATGVAHQRLTTRERLVVQHLATGATLPTIAERLTVSVNTVKSQVRSIYLKLGVTSRSEAIDAWRAAQDEGPAID